MQFLGSLGINRQLLIAQVINFALLVWLLSYFVYKPTLRMIEENETELSEGFRQKEALEKEKSAFAKERETEAAAIKSRNKKAFGEILVMAEAIKGESLEKNARDSVELVKQTRTTLELEKPTLEKKLRKEIKSEFGSRFGNSFAKLIPSGRAADLEKIIFDSFIKAIKADLPDMAKKDREIAELRKLVSTNGAEYRKKIEQKFGVILLEYAVALTPHQRDAVANLVAKKTGLKLPLKTRRNESLVSGFRLEIAGMLIDSSVSHLIHNAEKK